MQCVLRGNSYRRPKVHYDILPFRSVYSRKDHPRIASFRFILKKADNNDYNE